MLNYKSGTRNIECFRLPNNGTSKMWLAYPLLLAALSDQSKYYATVAAILKPLWGISHGQDNHVQSAPWLANYAQTWWLDPNGQEGGCATVP